MPRRAGARGSPLPARVTIGGFTSSHGAGGVHIRVIDDSSRTIVLEFSMSHEAFGHALATHSEQPGMMELSPDNAGKIHEHKTETVAWDGAYNDEASKRKALKPFEVDGWIGYAGDLGNHHRSTRKNRNEYTVAFDRYVDPK
jgi:hypothetical protein